MMTVDPPVYSLMAEKFQTSSREADPASAFQKCGMSVCLVFTQLQDSHPITSVCVCVCERQSLCVCVCMCVSCLVYRILRKAQQFMSGSGGVNLWVGGVCYEPWDPLLTFVCAFVCVLLTCMFLWVSEFMFIAIDKRIEGYVFVRVCVLREWGGVEVVLID